MEMLTEIGRQHDREPNNTNTNADTKKENYRAEHLPPTSPLRGGGGLYTHRRVEGQFLIRYLFSNDSEYTD
jgi:hypothetical protein